MRSRERHLFFSSKDNRTVILTRQDFLPDRTADRDLLFIFSSNILDFRRSLSSYLKFGQRHEDSWRFYRQQGRLATRKSRSACFKNSFSKVKLASEVNCSKSSDICLICSRSSLKRIKLVSPVCYMSRLSLQQQRKNNRSEPKQSTRYFYQHKSNFQNHRMNNLQSTFLILSASFSSNSCCFSSGKHSRSQSDSYASFVLSNLPRASITPWLHAARLPFLNYIGIGRYPISHVYFVYSAVYLLYPRTFTVYVFRTLSVKYGRLFI